MEGVEKARSEAASWHPKLVSPNFVYPYRCVMRTEREREREIYLCVAI